jgi:hypothetical protein
VRIGVTREQQRLKEQHARGPHRWSTTKPWQEVFAQQELHPEKQKGAHKDGQPVVQQRASFPF